MSDAIETNEGSLLEAAVDTDTQSEKDSTKKTARRSSKSTKASASAKPGISTKKTKKAEPEAVIPENKSYLSSESLSSDSSENSISSSLSLSTVAPTEQLSAESATTGKTPRRQTTKAKSSKAAGSKSSSTAKKSKASVEIKDQEVLIEQAVISDEVQSLVSTESNASSNAPGDTRSKASGKTTNKTSSKASGSKTPSRKSGVSAKNIATDSVVEFTQESVSKEENAVDTKLQAELASDNIVSEPKEQVVQLNAPEFSYKVENVFTSSAEPLSPDLSSNNQEADSFSKNENHVLSWAEVSSSLSESAEKTALDDNSKKLGSETSFDQSENLASQPQEQRSESIEPQPAALVEALDNPQADSSALADASTDTELAKADDEKPTSRNRSRRNRGQRGRGKRNSEDAQLKDEAVSGIDEEELAAEMEDGEDKDQPASEAGSKAKERPRLKRKMFVSVLPGEQVEVAIAEEGALREYYVEMLHQVKIKGNIYKGVIHNVDANLQAAFVSYGAVKNGFLQIDEVHPDYYISPHETTKGHKYPLIQKVLKPGQEILVQVVKEPSGTKGAFLTSYVSMPGRFLVLTPGREQIGVSRKVDNDEERSRLKELLSGLEPGPGLGVIVRTVSMGASKSSLQRDLLFLKKVWRDVRAKAVNSAAPCLVYQEMDLAARAVRDYLTEDVTELWVDDDEVACQLENVVEMLFPKRHGMVQLHKDPEQSLFTRFGLKRQLDQVHGREVVLPSGGRLVFDHTEALTAIDINSGRTAGKTNFEDMAFKINLEAAQHIPLQLRLRDIGGQIVIDFIEMRDRNHWREVEKAIRTGMKEDRARHDVGKISSFGLLEIVRQRLGSSAISITSEPCPHCKGTGQRRNLEWQALQALRDIQRLARHNANTGGTEAPNIIYSASPELALYLLNNKKERLLDMEKISGIHIELRQDSTMR